VITGDWRCASPGELPTALMNAAIQPYPSAAIAKLIIVPDAK
jgi:hypothetical protein